MTWLLRRPLSFLKPLAVIDTITSTFISVRIFLPILVFLLVGKAIASPQVPDYIIYKGDTLPVYNLILEKYFELNNQSDEGSLFGLKFREGASTNCWRGYQAIYEIANDSLFLNHIISCGELRFRDSIDHASSKKRLKEIFGSRVVNDRVHINWFSDNISLPNGDILRWDGVFYTSFEKERLFIVERGVIKDVLEVENYIDAPNRLNRRYEDTISNVMFAALKKLKWKDFDEFDCSEKYLVTIDENGKVQKVTMADYQQKEDIEDFWDKKEYNYCIRTVSKGLKKLKFDIIKQNGKKVSEDVFIEIWFEDTGQIENWTE